MRTSNPALKPEIFEAESDRLASVSTSRPGAMTIGGTIAKSAFLLLICVAGAMLSYSHFLAGTAPLMPIAIGTLIGSAVLGLIMSFRPATSPYLAPVYAAVEGVFLGAVSLVFAAKFGPTIVFQAVTITFGILAAMLLCFSLGLIRVTGVFARIVVVATIGVGLTYLANIVMQLLGWGSVPFIHDSGPIGIGFSVFVIALASLNLVLDFQFVEQGVESRAPKYMEWYAGYGLLVTLVWLYLEVLRLLGKLRSND